MSPTRRDPLQFTLLGLQIGAPELLENRLPGPDAGTAAGTFRTAMRKIAVPGPVLATATGLIGDDVASTDAHGGTENAVCVYCAAHYATWQTDRVVAASGLGAFGDFGENLTLGMPPGGRPAAPGALHAGVTEDDVCIGDVFTTGVVEFEISKPREPCSKLNRRWGVPDLRERVRDTNRCGWYMRVRREGFVSAGDTLTLIARPNPAWTVARAHRHLYFQEDGPAGDVALSTLPGLAESWQARFARKLQ